MNMNVGDGYIAYPFAGLAIHYVRRLLDTKTRLPQWDWVLKRYWAAGGILLGLAALTHTDVSVPLWLIAFAATGVSIWLERTYQPARTLLLAVAPYAVIYLTSEFVKWVAPAFHKTYEDYFDSATAFAMLWVVVFYVIANRQKKALAIEQQAREAEAEQRRISEARRQELEYLVAERTAEIMSRKEELEHALIELKTTQNQLIQSEKMASLGELTAGIAHEIQNPLNFVNNFAEVSVELIDELTEEKHKPDRDADLEADLLTDLRQNLQKISQHGGRASSIVRGMLQHSRASTGQREPTDLNALCDEYLRLAYHGLRAKDKSFNAQFSTDLDPDLGLITVVPQDIGRVLLNLFTNAFYAVQQRQKTAPADYKPTVALTTQLLSNRSERASSSAHPTGVGIDRVGIDENGVVIEIRDNGIGIPESAMAKIFQPFFTTKPTGEGTGLGLSLAYDIVTKGHGGTLDVTSVDGEGTTFSIKLPA